MPETSTPAQNQAPIPLKDPLVAGVLAWLIPGLGHCYQGRYAKAGLFFVCILGTFLYGLYLASDPEIGWGRAVYFSFRQRENQGQYESDLRLAYLCQVGIGLPAMPALIQAAWDSSGQKPLWGGFMAPPRLEQSDPPQNPQWVPKEVYRLGRWFELATVYTMIAGLLNILAVYDACCGPVPPELLKKKEEDGRKAKNEEKDSQ